MIPLFIQKVLINSEKLKDFFNKGERYELYPRSCFDRVAEIINQTVFEKMKSEENPIIFFDLVSQEFKDEFNSNLNEIKRSLRLKQHISITGKTLYEYLTGRTQRKFGGLKSNRLLYFLDINYHDWDKVENISFEEYFNVPTQELFAGYLFGNVNFTRKAYLQYFNKTDEAQLVFYDHLISFKTQFNGTRQEKGDYYIFNLLDEKHLVPAILVIPREINKVITGVFLLMNFGDPGFQMGNAVFFMAENHAEINQLLDDNHLKTHLHFLAINNLLQNRVNPLESCDMGSEKFKRIFNTIVGRYICYTIGKNKDRLRSQSIVIQSDCTATFDSSFLYSETGVSFLSGSGKILVIKFNYDEDDFKYHFIINLNDSSIKEGKLAGVVSGINRSNEPFAERVYLVRIEENADFEPCDYIIDTPEFTHLIETHPELPSIFLGIANDFGSDFKFLYRLNSFVRE